MKTTIKILTILSAIILCAACVKDEQPQTPKKGINVIKTTPVTKSSMVDSSSVKGTPGHIKFPPVYGEE